MSAQAFRCLGCAALMSAAISVPLRTAAAEPPHLQTHQSYVEDVMRATTLDVGDPLAVFAFVLDSLPERVKIYPTEGYFYFNFVHNGVPYAGNIRLDASNRDDGKVNFAYFEQTTEWRDDTPGKFEVLDAGKGVALEKIDNFHYRLTFRGKSVVFELNDLSNVTPPAAALAPHETFIGPIFDDSAIRFFLIYNAAIKNFIYVLDETAKVADEFVPSKHSERMLTGKRTGFVFYRDHKRDRKILIGVYAENVRVNNYFDGPFDQLPDPYIKGETLRNAIIDVDPTKKGKIDRFGGSADGTVRFMIAPYALYEEERELYGIDRCATRSRHSSEARYYKCFVAK